MKNITIGVSSCLLGNKVRWKGDHKKNRAVVEYLSNHFSIKPVCPEAEIGMGVPREPVNLEGDYKNPEMIGKYSRDDWTIRMQRYSKSKIEFFEKAGVSGFVLKRNSPSCGLSKIPVYGNIGRPPKKGIGLFAKAITDNFINMPIVDEEFLAKSNYRNLFIAKVHIYESIFGVSKNKLNVKYITKLLKPFSKKINCNKYLYDKTERLLKSVNDCNSNKFKHEYYNFLTSMITPKSASLLLKNIKNNY